MWRSFQVSVRGPHRDTLDPLPAHQNPMQIPRVWIRGYPARKTAR